MCHLARLRQRRRSDQLVHIAKLRHQEPTRQGELPDHTQTLAFTNALAKSLSQSALGQIAQRIPNEFLDQPADAHIAHIAHLADHLLMLAAPWTTPVSPPTVLITSPSPPIN